MENENSEPRKVVDYEKVTKLIDELMKRYKAFIDNYGGYVKLFEEYEKQIALVEDASKRKVWVKLTDKELEAKLANYAHEAWSGWVQNLFDNSKHNPDGTVTIPKWAVSELQRQKKTFYADLPESEKKSYIAEAQIIIGLLK